METLTHPDSRMQEADRNHEANRRLEVLEDTIASYQEQYDFVEGVTVFGSTMHGDAHEKSDVDAMVFIDPDKVAQGHGVELDEADYSDLAGVVQNDLLAKLDLKDASISSGKRNDIKVFPINERIVDELINEFEQSDEELPMLHRSVSALFHPTVADGNRVGELRASVLSKIASSKNPQELWSEIVRPVWTFEGATHNEQSKIPEEFEDAQKVYSRVGD